MDEFNGRKEVSIGIEEEIQLIDPQSGDLVLCCDQVIDRLDSPYKESAGHELFHSVLETRSQVCMSVEALEKEILLGRKAVLKACQKCGVLPVAAGSHPFADWRKQTFIESGRHRWVIEQNQFLARRLLAFGLHVHIGMRSGEAAIYAQNQFRRWIYPLLALSANSPFYSGVDTGLASTRSHLFGAMPRTGLPPHFKDYADYMDLSEKLIKAADISEINNLWWAVRIQASLGTLEVRIFDLPTEGSRSAVFAAICQAAAATFQEQYYEGRPLQQLIPAYLDENHWKAMRYGLNSEIIEPSTGEIISMKKQLETFIDLILPMSRLLGCESYLEKARQMIYSEAEWEKQRRLYREKNSDFAALEFQLSKIGFNNPN